MSDAAYYEAKIAECRRMLEASDDPLARDIFQAMADEFASKLAALVRATGEAGLDTQSRDSKPKRGAIA
jgi:hypothetical protein